MARVEEASSDAGSGRQGLWLITLLLQLSACLCLAGPWSCRAGTAGARVEAQLEPGAQCRTGV
jgi:hypothetical protein